MLLELAYIKNVLQLFSSIKGQFVKQIDIKSKHLLDSLPLYCISLGGILASEWLF